MIFDDGSRVMLYNWANAKLPEVPTLFPLTYRVKLLSVVIMINAEAAIFPAGVVKWARIAHSSFAATLVGLLPSVHIHDDELNALTSAVGTTASRFHGKTLRSVQV